MQTLDRLIAYTSWANKAWLDFAFSAGAADPYFAAMISHIYLAEQVWFQRVHNEPLDSDVFATKTKEELLHLATRHDSRYAEILADDLDRTIAYRRFNGEAHESVLSDILLHLITHGAHHRGQMATAASKAKLPFPTTDFINYSRTDQR